MARFEMSGLDDVINQMRGMGQESGAVAKEMLTVGAWEVVTGWERAAEEHGLRDTGAMIDSIAPTKVKKGATLSTEIYPQGTDSKGVRNAAKAFYLHYGTSSIQATRWVDDAEAYSEETAIPAMTAVWEQFIATGKLSLNGLGKAGGIITKRG